MVWIDIATEDELSEAVARRLVDETPGLQQGDALRRQGNGYLRNKLGSFCEMARHRPVLMLTDLDNTPCPVELIQQWFRSLRKPDNLLFRVAVREIEAWLLSDHEAIVTLLGKKAASGLPNDPDTLPDPKQRLLTLARRAPRDIRMDLCPGPELRQGVGYNARLCEFVDRNWNIERAATRSQSLRRARKRLRDLSGVQG